MSVYFFFFFSSRRRHTRFKCDWSSDVCSSDLPIWAIPMDITPEYSGSASGFMNFGFGMAGIISPVVFGYAIDLTGRWDVPFVGSLAVLLLGALLALRCRPGERFVDTREDLTPILKTT